MNGESSVTGNQLAFGRQFRFDAYARPREVETIYPDGTRYLQRSAFDAYSRPFQSFFKALSDGLPETGEYFAYDQDTGIGIATRDVGFGTLGTLYSNVLGVDAFGNVSVEERKAGSTTLKVLKQFNPATGLTELIQAGTTSNPSSIQYLDMRWDRIDNLIYRNDQSAGRQLYEAFTYDRQQRLMTQKRGTQASNATTQVLALQYESTGNIKTKNGQSYIYGGICNGVAVGPQAVRTAFGTSYCYDTRGNQISSTDGRQVVYLPFDLPSEIKNQHVGTSFTASTAFDYGPNHERLTRRNYPNVFGVTGTSSETTHYVGSAEIHRRPSGVEVKRYVGGVLIVQTASELTKRYQWFDHQGSVTAITDLAGAPIGSDGQMSYDAFGLRRDVQGSEFTPLRGFSFNTTATTRHGYTGHEMVDEAGLIHMNGRMYDPKLARFIQADPLVQDPNNSQSLNRYSYVMNNPLNATDPSGLFSVGSFSSLFSSINAQASFGSGFMQSCANSSACATAFAARGGNGSATQLPAGSVLGAFNNSAPDVSGLLEPSGWCDGSHDCNVSRWESAYFRSDITERQFVDRNMQAGYGGMIGSGGVVGGLYLASMGAAAGAIGGGFLDGMGYYALAVDGGAPLATLLGGSEAAVLAYSGVLTPGSGVAGLAGRVEGAVANEATETFYRSMSARHYKRLSATLKLPATGETFTSPTKAFAAEYDGVLVQFNVMAGTTKALEAIGVRDFAPGTALHYGHLPTVPAKGWTSNHALFKSEGGQINIGLGRGAALDVFNSNIINFQAIPK